MSDSLSPALPSPESSVELLPRLPPPLSRGVNAAGMLIIGAVVALSTLEQMRRGEMPCPLCIMERIAFIGAATGLCLNLRFGPRASHYAIVIVSATAGAMIAARQVLLHITPDLRGIDGPAASLHLNSWALTLFSVIIAAGAFLMLVDRRRPGLYRRRRRLSPLGMAALFTIAVLTLANGLATLFECGAGACPEEPMALRLLAQLPLLPPWLDRLATAMP